MVNAVFAGTVSTAAMAISCIADSLTIRHRALSVNWEKGAKYHTRAKLCP
jgi:hypothetical protein